MPPPTRPRPDGDVRPGLGAGRAPRRARLNADDTGWLWFERPPDGREDEVYGRSALQQLRILRELRATEAALQARARGTPPGDCPLTSDSSEEEDELLALARTPPPPDARAFRRPPPCSFLVPGMTFHGRQRVAGPGSGPRRDDAWDVVVTVDAVDAARGTLCGTMRADNVPHARGAVETWFSGEIVDNVNHTFITPRWGARADADARAWARFPGYAAALGRQAAACDGRAASLARAPHVYMRWKEEAFLGEGREADRVGLSIAGFYYVRLDRATGAVAGWWADPAGPPSFQRLDLKPGGRWGGGHCVGEYQFR